MKILHVSDLHLDSPFIGIGNDHSSLQKRLIHAPYDAFKKCVQLAIQENVDVILITGDIYNSERQTIYAQHFFYKQLEILNESHVPVIIIHGNHDYIRSDRSLQIYPKNVHVFNQNTVQSVDIETKSHEIIRVYGLSYTTKWLNESVVESFPNDQGGADLVIGMLHGAIETSDPQLNRYAPFTVDKLKSKNYHYWALGHIHKQDVLADFPLCQYSGTIQGRHRNETGDKGCFIVEFNNGIPVSNQFHSLAPIIWEHIELECQSDWQVSNLMEHCQQVIDNFKIEAKAKHQSYIIEIFLNQAHRLSQEILEQIQAGELKTALEEEIDDQDYFVYLNRIQTKSSLIYNVFEFDQSLKKSFEDVSANLSNLESMNSILRDLFQHNSVQRHFPELKAENFKQSVFNTAKERIVQLAGLDFEVEDERLDN